MPIILGAILSAACWLAAATALAEPDLPHGGPRSPVHWLAGRALLERLEEPVDVNWSAAPLRAALYGLARSKQVAVLLDRRIDPDRRLDVTLSSLPLRQALVEIAARQDAAAISFGPLVYLGPAASASRLGAVAELRRREAAGLGRNVAQRLLAERPMRWDDLAEPRRLLAELAREANLEIVDLERVPHDAWAAADLPAMPLVDRITLVTVQFDLTFTLAGDGRTLRLTAIPDRLPAARPSPPSTTAARRGNAARTRPSPEGEKRFTLRQARGPLRELLPKLAAMLQVDLRIDEEALRRAGISLDQPVSISITDATADELFEKLLAPAGCSMRREGRTIVVVPK